MTHPLGRVVEHDERSRDYPAMSVVPAAIQHLLGALQLGPVIVGTNWYEGMDTLRDGFVSAVGSVRGGHEWVVLGWQQGFLTGLNSWGPEWGLRGTFHIRTTDMDQLLHEHGDVTVPVR